MDGENNGNPYEQMDDLGGKTHYFSVFTPIYLDRPTSDKVFYQDKYRFFGSPIESQTP